MSLKASQRIALVHVSLIHLTTTSLSGRTGITKRFLAGFDVSKTVVPWLEIFHMGADSPGGSGINDGMRGTDRTYWSIRIGVENGVQRCTGSVNLAL